MTFYRQKDGKSSGFYQKTKMLFILDDVAVGSTGVNLIFDAAVNLIVRSVVFLRS
jgi:hypothetical protein